MSDFFWRVPSGELSAIFEKAVAVAQADEAVCVELKHFLWAALFMGFEPNAFDVARVVADIGTAWEHELEALAEALNNVGAHAPAEIARAASAKLKEAGRGS